MRGLAWEKETGSVVVEHLLPKELQNWVKDGALWAQSVRTVLSHATNTTMSLVLMRVKCTMPPAPLRCMHARSGGDSGMLKMTMPTAFTTALLAWGLLSFPQGYSQAGMTATAQAELTWGANYLLKAVGGTNASYLISQVSLLSSLCSGAEAA